MTLPQLLAHRRLARDRADTRRTNDALWGVVLDLRRRAQVQVAAGHPELATPYLEEARVFEDAVQAVPAL